MSSLNCTQTGLICATKYGTTKKKNNNVSTSLKIGRPIKHFNECEYTMHLCDVIIYYAPIQ